MEGEVVHGLGQLGPGGLEHRVQGGILGGLFAPGLGHHAAEILAEHAQDAAGQIAVIIG